MIKQKAEKGRTDNFSGFSSEDHSIYPHRDHVTKDGIPFNLGNYGDDGVFSEQQIVELCGRHNLSKGQLRELSRLVGYALDEDSYTNFVKISRSKVQRRLDNPKLVKNHRDISIDVKEANALFDALGLKIAVLGGTASAEPISEAQFAATDATGDVRFISLNEAKRVLQPDDLRKERDSRRLLVVESCCYVALEAGWPITYTTDSAALKNQRGGRLIELIKDVIALVSHHAHIASVHTLKADIELVRHRFEMREDLPARTRG